MDFPWGISEIPLGHFSRDGRELLVATQPSPEFNLGSGTIWGRPASGAALI